MPNVDGPSAARTLRSHNIRTPIVAMSTALDEELTALEAGCDLFLPKPVSRDTLKASLLSILATQKLRATQPTAVADGPRRHSAGDLPRSGSRPILSDLDAASASSGNASPNLNPPPRFVLPSAAGPGSAAQGSQGDAAPHPLGSSILYSFAAAPTGTVAANGAANGSSALRFASSMAAEHPGPAVETGRREHGARSSVDRHNAAM